MAAATQYFIAAKTGTANRELARREGFGVLYLPGWTIDPDAGQAWAYDNGAYADYLERAKRQGLTPFVDMVYGEAEQGDLLVTASELPGIDTHKWVRGLHQVAAHPSIDSCVLVALPDLVNDARSLDKSIEALELALAEGLDLPYYLVVQPDPADPRDESGAARNRVGDVLEAYPQIAGLFIGGDNEFKSDLGPAYADLARFYGRRIHYGRASSRRKIRQAVSIGAETCDSTQHQRYQSWYQVSDVDPHNLGEALDGLTFEELARLLEINNQAPVMFEEPSLRQAPIALGDDLDAEWQRRLWADEITAEEWDAHEATPEQARRLEIDTRLADLGLLVNHGLTAGEYSVTPHLYSRSLNELGQVALKEAA